MDAMRALVTLDSEDRARLLGDALYAEGVDTRVAESRDGGFVVWVHDETQLDRARDLLQVFERSPDDPRFERARHEAEARRRAEQKVQKSSRHRAVPVREEWRSRGAWGQLTVGLIVFTVAVTVLAGFGDNTNVTAVLYCIPDRILDQGEAWRLITPIFLHLNLLHLAFNMWWLKDFGTFIERRHSPWMLAALVISIGVLSNMAQALLVHWKFGGMSGVVYGLFGYIWVRGRLDPTFGVRLERATVIILVGWMLLGFTGMMRMANMAHLGGLVVGVAWAVVTTARARLR
jgi:GlpG protein